jgi:hypothetical protein
MMVKFFEKNLKTMLPLYLTGRLSNAQRRIVEAWLRRSPAARADLEKLRSLKSDIELERQVPLAPEAWPRLDVRSSAGIPAARPVNARTWGFGMVLGLLLFLFAWFAIPPAVELQWSVDGTSPIEFHVYRAEAAAASFELVEAIPADEPATSYVFRDYQLLPGREYVYRIEAIGPNNQAIANDWVTGDASLVLPGQLALLTAGLISLYGIWVYIDRAGALRGLHAGRRAV